MRRPLLLLLVALLPAAACAEEARQRHAWGRFPVGSWKSVRIRKQTFADGMLTGSSVEESKTTLAEAGDKQYTLEVVSRVKIAGQELDSNKSIQLTYHGGPRDQPVEVKTVDPDAELELEGVRVPCRIVEVRFETADARWVRTMHLSDVYDGPLQLQTSAVGKEDETPIVTTFSQVQARGLLQTVLGESYQAAVVRTVLQRPMSRQTTFEIHCSDVPGGVVEFWSKVTDQEGQLAERSTLEILDFGVPAAPP